MPIKTGPQSLSVSYVHTVISQLLK